MAPPAHTHVRAKASFMAWAVLGMGSAVRSIVLPRIMSLSQPTLQVSRDTKLCAIGLQCRELLRRNASTAIGRVLQSGQKLPKCEDAHTADPVRRVDFLHGGTVPQAPFLPVQGQQYGRGRRSGLVDQLNGLTLGGAIR